MRTLTASVPAHRLSRITGRNHPSNPDRSMVEYAVLLSQNASEIMGMTGGDVAAWVSGLNWIRIGTAILALGSVRVIIWAFGGR